MNPVDLITEHLDVWTTAQAQKTAGRGKSTKNQSIYGIKKLRELILELAVRGKLVPQDSNDEPTGILLEKIKPERDRIIKEGKFKTLAKVSPVDNTSLLPIPESWRWVQLNDLAAISRGGSPRPIKSFLTDSPDGINWIKIGDTDRKYRFIESTAEKIRKEGLEKSRMVYPGDLILSNSMSYGFPYILKIEGCIHDGWLVIRTPKNLLDKMYLCYLFLSPYAKNSFDSMAAGAVVQNLNADKVRMLTVALPPLAEQHRIVAKVDELMALCDQQEQQKTNSNATHQTLVKTLLATLTHPTTGADETESDAIKLFFQHFDTLFTTEQSIDQLKQTILQLAVMGKLVSQDPNDEPARTLLRKIAEEKERLTKTGEIKKQKLLPEISDAEKSFKLPSGWEWSRLDSLSLHSEAGWSPRCRPTSREDGKWGILKVSAVTWGVFNPAENKELPSDLEPRTKYEVTPGDFLISRANTADLVARAVVVPNGVPKRLMMSDKIIRFVFSKEMSVEYINLVNNSEISRAYYSSVAGGTSSSMKNVSREQIRKLVIGVPPLPEQHRIVAKIDELMAHCEALKLCLIDTQTTQLQLADAVVVQAVAKDNRSLYWE